MRKMLLRVLTLILAVTLLAAPVAFADTPEQQGVGIQLNGKLIDFPNGVLPVIDENAGKVFVPFRDMFEALGAEVSYNEATRTASAVLEDAKIDFNLDNSEIINVTRGGVTKTLTMDVPARSVNGRMLVPVRFISETVGANVGWDEWENTVVIFDARTILASYTAEYTILDKLLKLQANSGNRAGKAILDFDMTMNDTDYGEIKLPLDMTIDFVSSGVAFDGKFNIKTDLTDIVSSSVPGLSAKYEINGEIILNAQKGQFAIQCDTLSAMIDPSLKSGTWLTMDASELLAELQVENDTLQFGNAEELINQNFRSMIDNYYITSVYDYEELEGQLSAIRDLLSDEAFVKTGNDYVRTLDNSVDGGSDIVEITLKTNNAGEAISASVSLGINLDGTVIKMTSETDGKDTKIDLSVSDELMEMELEVSFEIKTQGTTKSPRTKVPAGAATFDLNGSM